MVAAQRLGKVLDHVADGSRRSRHGGRGPRSEGPEAGQRAEPTILIEACQPVAEVPTALAGRLHVGLARSTRRRFGVRSEAGRFRRSGRGSRADAAALIAGAPYGCAVTHCARRHTLERRVAKGGTRPFKRVARASTPTPASRAPSAATASANAKRTRLSELRTPHGRCGSLGIPRCRISSGRCRSR